MKKKLLFLIFLLSGTFGCFAAAADVAPSKEELAAKKAALLQQAELLMKDWVAQFPGDDEQSLGLNVNALAKHLFSKHADVNVAETAVFNLYEKRGLQPSEKFISTALEHAGYKEE